jgi:hypothetical protein
MTRVREMTADHIAARQFSRKAWETVVACSASEAACASASALGLRCSFSITEAVVPFSSMSRAIFRPGR